MTFDAARSRTLLFGGAVLGAGQTFGDTWEWDGATWSQRSPPASPAARFLHSAAFDAARGVVVTTGGHGGTIFTFHADAWEWDGSTWTQRLNQQPELQRQGAAVAFHAATGQLVLFGGRMGGAGIPRYPANTLGWNGTNLVELVPRSNPEGNIDDLVFDPVRRRIAGFSYFYREAWTWDGASWTSVAMLGGPSNRAFHAVAPDPARGRIVLFGGNNAASNLGDTWEWDGVGWTQRMPVTSPSARSDHAMVWHARSQRIVLFGGGDNQTWEWDGTDWFQRTTPIAPGPRVHHVMADDTERGVVVLYGGDQGPLNDTWEWDGATWTFRPVVGAPIGWPMRMVHDPHRRRSVLYGRHVTSGLQETWEWDGTVWMQRSTMTGESGGVLAHDPLRGVTVLYNGNTWEYGPTFPASTAPFGNGCAGSVGVPTLVATARPWLGDTMRLVTGNLAPSVAFVPLVMGWSDQVWNGLTLPVSLQAVGMPGCDLLIGADAVAGMAVGGSTARFDLGIPNDPTLLGLAFHHQAAVFEPSANAAGIVVSNAVRCVVGGR